MNSRLFPEPFKMTQATMVAIQSPQTTPVGKVQQVLLLSASFLIDLAFLPPSVAESIARGEQLRLPGG